MIPSQDATDAQYGVVTIDLVFTAIASGGVPTTLDSSTGIVSVTKSTNDYLVVFDQTYVKFLGGAGNILQASVNVATAYEVKHTAANAGAAGGATATLSPSSAAGAPQALAVGDILSYQFRFARIPQPNS